MKLLVNRAALVEALGLASSVVLSRTPKPVLTCVKLVAGEGGGKGAKTLSLIATDMEIALQYTLTQVDIASGGVALIPAGKLSEIVNNSPDDTLTLETTADTTTIKGSDAHYKVFGYNAEEFPPVSPFEGDPDLTLSAGALRTLLDRTRFAAAKEMTRYAINGVLFEKKGKKVLLVATDGHRLAQTKDDAASDAGKDVSAVVPIKAINLIERLLTDPEQTVALQFKENKLFVQVSSETGGVTATMSTALVEGTFPPYQDVIPKDSDKKVTLNRDRFASAVRRAALLTNEESKGVRLSFSERRPVDRLARPGNGRSQDRPARGIHRRTDRNRLQSHLPDGRVKGGRPGNRHLRNENPQQTRPAKIRPRLPLRRHASEFELGKTYLGQHHDAEHLLSLEYVIYTDESDTKGAVYSHFYGGALVQSPHLAQVQQTLITIKEGQRLFGEIKWSKVTDQYLDKYIVLLNTFFDLVQVGTVKIRIMFMQNRVLPHRLPGYQREHSFFLLYYQFIKHAFGLRFSNATDQVIRVRVYLDQLPDTQEKASLFKSHLVALSNSPAFRHARIVIAPDQIAEVDSHEHVVLQCLDVVLGAMNFRLNKKHLDKPAGARNRGRKTIAKHRLYQIINQRIRAIYPGFNVGISTGRNGDYANVWKHPYRHWSFVPSMGKPADPQAIAPDNLT